MIKLEHILLPVFIAHMGLQAMGRGCEEQVFSAAKRFGQLSVSADIAQSHAAQAGTSAVAAESRISQTEAFLRHNPTFMGKESINPEDYEGMSRKVREVEEAHPEHFSFISGISHPWYLAFKFMGKLLERRNIQYFPGWELAICAPSNIVAGNARTFVNGNQDCRNRLQVDYSFPGQWRDGSPFDVFLTNHEDRDCAYNIDSYLCEWFKKLCFGNVDLMSCYVEMRLAEIAAATDSRRGCVLQLLVRRDGVDEHVYLGQHGRCGAPFSCYYIGLTPGGVLPFETGKISPFLTMLTDPTGCEQLREFLPEAWPQVVLHRGLFAENNGIETCVHTEFSEQCAASIEDQIQRIVTDITGFSLETVFEYAAFLSLHSKHEKVRVRAIIVLKGMVSEQRYRDKIFSLLAALLADESDWVRANAIVLCTRLIEDNYRVDDIADLVSRTKTLASYGEFLTRFKEVVRRARQIP